MFMVVLIDSLLQSNGYSDMVRSSRMSKLFNLLLVIIPTYLGWNARYAFG